VSEIILASQSPRRRKLLNGMGVKFKVIPSSFDEKLDESRDPCEVAKELALGKALDVARQYPEAYVIGSDTIVAIDGRQMEKPNDVDEAYEMLLSLSEGESIVSTGVAVVNISRGIELVEENTTRVFFKPDSPEVRQARQVYLDTEDWRDKAGGYGIQSGAAPLIDRIEGDYDTVVGLPTRTLAKMLDTVGIYAVRVVEESPVPQGPRFTI
jgi:septum formation protein